MTCRVLRGDSRVGRLPGILDAGVNGSLQGSVIATKQRMEGAVSLVAGMEQRRIRLTSACGICHELA